MEKNKFQLNNSFFDLVTTIKNSLDSLSFFAKQKSIQPVLQIDSDIEKYLKNINGDEGRFS